MRNTRGFFLASLFSVSLVATAYAKPKPIVAPSDVIARVRAAHTIFIAGPYGMAYGGAPYLVLYQALSAWHGVQIADNPSHADLIFQAWGTQTDDYELTAGGHTVDDVTYAVNFQVVDPNGGAILWSTSSSDGSTSPKTLAQVLLSLEPQLPAPKPLKVSAPLPSQIRLGNRAYLQAASYDAGSAPPEPGIDAIIAQAVKASGLYTFVDSPASADIILAPLIKFYPPLTRAIPDGWPGYFNLQALDPSTKILIWSNSNDLVTGRFVKFSTSNKQGEADRLQQTMPYVLMDWKKIITTKAISK
jgi:hypothetical protein